MAEIAVVALHWIGSPTAWTPDCQSGDKARAALVLSAISSNAIAGQQWRTIVVIRHMQRPICPKCNKLPVDYHKSGWRKSCWSCRSDKPRRNSRLRARLKEARSLVVAHYGGKCKCCGEEEPLFLAIDHKNDDGSNHRKEIGRGLPMYRWIIDNGFPDTLQLLCHNCNYGRYANGGICPHHK